MLGLGSIAKKLFGTTNDRKIKAAQRTVDAVNALEPDMEALSDEALRGKTVEFRQRLEAGESLDDSVAGGIRRRSRSLEARPGDAPVRRADRRRADPAPGFDLGDEDR